jgi:hypothetical protein
LKYNFLDLDRVLSNSRIANFRSAFRVAQARLPWMVFGPALARALVGLDLAVVRQAASFPLACAVSITLKSPSSMSCGERHDLRLPRRGPATLRCDRVRCRRPDTRDRGKAAQSEIELGGDEEVIELARKLVPSTRGEYEITDLNNRSGS